MIRMQPDQFNLMPHTDMEFPDSETIRVWKTGSLEPDINTYAGVVGSSFHNGTIEADVCGRLRSDAPDYARGFIGIVFRAADDGRAEKYNHQIPSFAAIPHIFRGKLIHIRVSRGAQSRLFIFFEVLPQDPVKPVRCFPQVSGIIGGKDVIRPDINLAADIIQHLIQAFQAHKRQVPVALFRRLRHLPMPV